MKKKKLREWAKEHKYELSIGAACIVGGGLAILGVKSFESTKSKNKVFKSFGEKKIGAFTGMGKRSRYIDEDIFVDLAPKIQTAVLDKDIEKACIEKAYDLGENLSKQVTVMIENVYGD